jgi:flagellar biosynthetic protein FliQ
MSLGFVINLIQTSIFELLIISAPLLLIGMGVGLIISIFQATTSIQEQTLTFVPKIVAILAALVIFGPWMFGSMMQFTVTLFDSIPGLSK